MTGWGALYGRVGFRGYQVRRPGWGGSTRAIGGPVTAEEAVALVVANLPEGTGAAVAGTADEL